MTFPARKSWKGYGITCNSYSKETSGCCHFIPHLFNNGCLSNIFKSCGYKTAIVLVILFLLAFFSPYAVTSANIRYRYLDLQRQLLHIYFLKYWNLVSAFHSVAALGVLLCYSLWETGLLHLPQYLKTCSWKQSEQQLTDLVSVEHEGIYEARWIVQFQDTSLENQTLTRNHWNVKEHILHWNLRHFGKVARIILFTSWMLRHDENMVHF